MILITGAKGQLGYDFQRLFDSLEIEYLATDSSELDITDIDVVDMYIDNNIIQKGKRLELIINCAAYNNVDRAEEERELCYKINAYAPRELALLAKKYEADFITYSTDFVFDGEKFLEAAQEGIRAKFDSDTALEMGDSEEAGSFKREKSRENRESEIVSDWRDIEKALKEFKGYSEEDAPNPLSVYSKAKREGEILTLGAYDRAYVVRTSWVFGVANNNFNKQVLNWASTRDRLSIVDDQISVPTYSKDLAFYSWELIKSKKYGLYHLANSGVASKYDQAKYLLEGTGWSGELSRGKTSDFPLPAKRSIYSKLDSSKLESVIGMKIPTWQDAIDRYMKEIDK